ncbi:hypothetical protein GCM10022224_087380 [Nonomuraea antimicrobica]|uniref:Gas vesicle protein K n=1 Tax=Nonomuraea antimicrobica TaxID=561173 RepID=A0ABP7DP83_9ACTN
MNAEAEILDLMARLRGLNRNPRTADDITPVMLLVLMRLDDVRTEIRRDLAALGDELAALRRHLNKSLTYPPSAPPTAPASCDPTRTLSAAEPSAHEAT